MARRGANYSKNFRSAASFQKTYNRYKRAYFARARQIYKKLNGIPAKQKVRVTQEELKEYMYDNELLTKREFASTYKDIKSQLEKLDSSSDPTQYIVSQQAYKYSKAQYEAFTKVVRENEDFSFLRGMSMQEFRTGSFRSKEFYDKLKELYSQKKQEYKELGYLEEELSQLAAKEVSLFFGSK